MAAITITDVKKSYGKTAVIHGVDLAIDNGEFVVILGPSGCGKSTLLRMIAGLEAIDAGTIAIDGIVVNRLEPRQRGCAMVFQNYALYPHMSVADNIGYALKVAGMRKAERDEHIRKVAAIVGLGDFLARKPSELSGGQRQRVAMARAMIRQPKVFLFDEPLSNLDATLRVQMRMELRQLHQRLGATSVLVTHDQIEAMSLADRMVVMNAGRIEQVGTPRELYLAPQTRFVAAFIGSPAMNMLKGTLTRPGLARLASGHVLSFDSAIFAGTPGQSVDIGIRPEDVTLSHFSGSNTFQMQPAFIEELGATKLLHGHLGDEVFAVSAPLAHDVGTANLAICLPPEKLHIFDSETGRRLEGQPQPAPHSDKAAAMALA